MLSSFSCHQDEDIERFLHSRAIEFERTSKARTYLICDAEQLCDEGISSSQLIIYGYISLALKVLSIPDEISNRQRKELDGLYAKSHGEPIRDVPCYLIGQLSKNSNVPRDSISGRQLLEFAERIIAMAAASVGGRYIMIECREKEKLIKFYSDNEFYEICRLPDDNHTMVQMIRKIS